MGVRLVAADSKVARLAGRQLGNFSRAQARGQGASRGLIASRVEARLWIPVFGDVLRLRDAPRNLEQRAMAGVLAIGAPAGASHRTAGALWRLEGVTPPAEPEIITFAKRRVIVPGVRVRRSRHLVMSDITTRGVIPITDAYRTMLDLAAVLSVPALEDALDDAIRRELIVTEVLLDRIEGCPRQGRSGIADLRRLLRKRVDRPVALSGYQNRLRRLLTSNGLPEPLTEYEVWEDGKFLGQPDLAYPSLRIAIEFDGFREHSGFKRWARQAWRQNRLEDAGWRIRRFTSEDLRVRPLQVVAMIDRLLREQPLGP